MTPDRFIDYTMETIREVEQRVGKTGELESMDASSPLDLKKLGGLKLFCLHIL